MLLVITLVFSFLMSNPDVQEENVLVDTQASVPAVKKLLNLEMPVLAVTLRMKSMQTNTSCIPFGSAVTVKNVLFELFLQHPESVLIWLAG